MVEGDEESRNWDGDESDQAADLESDADDDDFNADVRHAPQYMY